jgi:hypothetical protein
LTVYLLVVDGLLDQVEDLGRQSGVGQRIGLRVNVSFGLDKKKARKMVFVLQTYGYRLQGQFF